MNNVKTQINSAIHNAYYDLSFVEISEYPSNFWKWVFTDKGSAFFDAFVSMAKRTKSKGFKNYGAKGLVEIMRWHTPIRDGGKLFKICNDYTSGLARLAMLVEPELDGFFRTRSPKGGAS